MLWAGKKREKEKEKRKKKKKRRGERKGRKREKALFQEDPNLCSNPSAPRSSFSLGFSYPDTEQ